MTNSARIKLAALGIVLALPVLAFNSGDPSTYVPACPSALVVEEADRVREQHARRGARDVRDAVRRGGSEHVANVTALVARQAAFHDSLTSERLAVAYRADSAVRALGEPYRPAADSLRPLFAR